MKPVLIIIRGSSASGKSTLARGLTKYIEGKVALLIVDEFRWLMTAHENRDRADFAVSFDNYLYALENYLKLGYTIITEDAWVRKLEDNATSIKKVAELGKKYNADIYQVLLKGRWSTIRHINTLRPMVIPQKELKVLYNKAYSKHIRAEVVIDIDNKKPNQILREVLATL